MTSTQPFDIKQYIDKKLGPLTLFPSEFDWSNATKKQILDHLTEIREICFTFDQAILELPNRSMSNWARAYRHIFAHLKSGDAQMLENYGAEWLAFVDDLIDKVNGATAPSAPSTALLEEKITRLD